MHVRWGIVIHIISVALHRAYPIESLECFCCIWCPRSVLYWRVTRKSTATILRQPSNWHLLYAMKQRMIRQIFEWATWKVVNMRNKGAGVITIKACCVGANNEWGRTSRTSVICATTKTSFIFCLRRVKTFCCCTQPHCLEYLSRPTAMNVPIRCSWSK